MTKRSTKIRKEKCIFSQNTFSNIDFNDLKDLKKHSNYIVRELFFVMICPNALTLLLLIKKCWLKDMFKRLIGRVSLDPFLFQIYQPTGDKSFKLS